jgi:hypothetical protein
MKKESSQLYLKSAAQITKRNMNQTDSDLVDQYLSAKHRLTIKECSEA